ncbi:MAG: hypothetical protein RRZ65_05890 [Tannerellaceae bacterium]
MARKQTLKGRIAGATKSYMGNTGRHQLVPGNKMGSHNQVYCQVRKGLGLSAG